MCVGGGLCWLFVAVSLCSVSVVCVCIVSMCSVSAVCVHGFGSDLGLISYCSCQSVFCSVVRVCVCGFKSYIGLRRLLVAVSLCSVSVVCVCIVSMCSVSVVFVCALV